MTALARVRRVVERLAAFLAVWFVLAEGDFGSWPFGVVFAAMATVASIRLTPVREWRIHPRGLLWYLGFFAYQAFIGGVDVAIRAIRPSLPLNPDLVCYRFRIEPEYARVLLADTVSLLPGTLSAGIEGDTLTAHVLDVGLDVEQSMRDVEEKIAGLFGLTLSDEGGFLQPCPIGPKERCS